MSIDSTRSYEPILKADLRRLAEIAKNDRREFFLRNPRYAALQYSVVAVALCQGAGLHFLDGKNGIKDIDVWTFYASSPGLRYPPRRPVMSYDFGDPKFGTTPDYAHFVGRRVDCLGRSLDVETNEDPIKAIQNFLTKQATDSACELAKKALVIIEPEQLVGVIAWPVNRRLACQSDHQPNPASTSRHLSSG
jgi:hypothetical protein